MTAQELIDVLSKVAPETEIVAGTWNGRVDTYTVIDKARVFLYDQIYADFYGTSGAFDDRLMDIRSKEVVYLDSLFDVKDKRVTQDRRIIWRMQHVLSMHRSRQWKQERICKMLEEFRASAFKNH